MAFDEAVYPTSLEIYETYNPGCIVKILAADVDVYNFSGDGFVKYVLPKAYSSIMFMIFI